MLTLHFLFEWLAYIISFTYYQYLCQHTSDHLNNDQRFWIIIAAAIGALVGSRLLDVLEHLNMVTQVTNPFLFIISSKTIVGAILGATIAVEIAKKIIHIHESTGDLFTFPLILAMMIGRIGCLLDGLHDGTIGIETTLPWGINFGDGINRHPTSLYEIIFLGLLWYVLTMIKNKSILINGELYRLFLLSYLSYRFLVGFIQPTYPLFIGLSAIQLASLIAILYYSKTLYNIWKRLYAYP